MFLLLSDFSLENAVPDSTQHHSLREAIQGLLLYDKLFIFDIFFSSLLLLMSGELWELLDQRVMATFRYRLHDLKPRPYL